MEEPWYLISHGVHHWEENGIFPNETTPTLPPYPVVYAQQYLKNVSVLTAGMEKRLLTKL